jgi:hypothetical protein
MSFGGRDWERKLIIFIAFSVSVPNGSGELAFQCSISLRTCTVGLGFTEIVSFLELPLNTSLMIIKEVKKIAMKTIMINSAIP